MQSKQKYFIFTIDDNIRFFRELTEGNGERLFSHPYLALLKNLHGRWGVKVQLNCFLEDMDGFHLSQMPKRYQAEWAENADWLKLSFHSKKEFPIEPYKQADYTQMYDDCAAVHEEIKRFAGENSLAKTTTVHFCLATEGGVKALKDCKMKGLLGLYGTDEEPQESYVCSLRESEKIRKGEIVEKDGIQYAAIDVILNLHEPTEIVELLEKLQGRERVEIMIHEQYFYADYPYYQENFQEKLEAAVGYLTENGYKSMFFEELL
ncbi:MAG: hypothetical protein IJX87_00170 [Clostridia bacterium]|nr:hypothetical protein [Clostridia bacterium]